ncbi:MutS-related protein [Mucilaginibacter psychrotolerans]|uniref:DNA mismatch repair protein n=1 Tax=Mucilaginibacter psychrotolerans TaxID=1524096 RepID=A0A4Y8SH34_9SPHI|nr:DNA mismatch repair protein [Mucilaginibacter psychrotolerans]TFF37764.1 DNA mismatch repair protein [Mucilaginibacter psychrotolerans]
MAFNTDQQTLEDLNIFPGPGPDSVFNLFNRTRTAKGAEMLEEMFRYPLSDAEAINNRSSRIKHFAENNTVFPFNTELFDMAEQYLADTDERTRLKHEKQTFEKRLNNLISSDAGYQIISNGINAILNITHQLKTLLASDDSEAGPYYRDNTILSLLSSEPFAALLKESAHVNITGTKLIEFDSLLRFQHLGSVRELLQYIYVLDVLISVGRVAKEHGFVLPQACLTKQGNTGITGFYHPLLKNAVPNDLTFESDKNICFLTGANMAGKSTFMKSIGIAMYLGHMGFPVPAGKMEFAVMDGIFTTINLPDNLGIGASHFYAEVLRLKKIARELSLRKNILVIFDELFRGTNVKDAYEATVAVTSAFAKKHNSLFVISTHITEAGETLREQNSSVSFKYLPTRMNADKPVYSYTLENGISADRHGMLIIENEGILDILKNGQNKKNIS